MIPRTVLAALVALAVVPASANAALFGVTWNSHPHGNPEVARFGVLWPYGYAIDPNVHAQSIVNTGSKEVRLQFLWDQIETARGVYDWTGYDLLVQKIRAKGLGVFPIVYMTPTWHRPNRTDPPDPYVYAEFLVKVAQRYNFPAYEVWNEPNWRVSSTQPLDWGGTYEQYAELYRVSRAALHAHDAHKDAVLGGLAYLTGAWANPPHHSAAQFLEWIWDDLGPVDAVGLHPYGFGSDPVADSMNKVKQLVNFLNSKGSTAPVDLTEIGMTVPPETERKRSDYLKSFAAKAKEWKRIRRVTVFTWHGTGENEQWSIARQDGSWKGSASGWAKGIAS
jgi:hypothetical protein